MVAVEVLCAGAVLAPLAVCVASGLVHASLWLDEITYHYMEDDLALRAAELGRQGSSVAPRLGIFFYCDVQRVFHAMVRPLGLTLARDPELCLRLLSLIAYAIAVVALYAFARKRGGRAVDAALVAGAFGSMPILVHYAFEGRVYELTTMLLVLIGIAVHGAARRPSPGRLVLVAALAAVAAHSHLWTLCLFGPLLLVAALDVARARRMTPWAAAAVAGAIPAWIGGGALVCLLGLSAWPSRTGGEEGDARRFSSTVACAFVSCWLLAITYGYYRHASYHVPLLGVLFVAVALVPTRVKRLLFGLIIAVNVALLPSTIRAIELKGSVRQVAQLILASGTRDVSVVCQHVVIGGFPVPAQAICLDPGSRRSRSTSFPTSRSSTGGAASTISSTAARPSSTTTSRPRPTSGVPNATPCGRRFSS
jgi:hypothetical protein